MQTMTIGELARRAELNVETLRYYERRGLLAAPARRSSGYRQYTPDDLVRIRVIRRAQQLGFTLREILDLLPILDGHGPLCAPLRQRAEAKLQQLGDKIRQLEQARASLEQLLGACTEQPESKATCELATSFVEVADQC